MRDDVMSEPCIKEDKINRIEADVININDRLNRHSDKIDKISDNNLVLETILKRLEEDGKEQKIQNAEVNRTMLSIQGAMTEITFNIKELNTKLIETDKKANDANIKASKVDEKSKIDFLEYFKIKILPWIFGGAGLGGMFALIDYLNK
jgi:outer membrane murein-binding lipoprotein Lpp